MSRQNEKSPQPRRRRVWCRVDPVVYQTMHLLKKATGISINTIINNGIDLEVNRLKKRSARGASPVAQ